MTENTPTRPEADEMLDEAVATAEEAPADAAESAETPVEPDYEQLLAERTNDLQRLQAEYVNYKHRVDRDRSIARHSGIEAVVLDLLPVLDAIAAARSHGELDAGVKLIADELEKIASKYGLVSYGVAGEAFDPQLHDALMMAPGRPEQTGPEIAEVLQAGYQVGDRIVRHARVIVAEPQG